MGKKEYLLKKIAELEAAERHKKKTERNDRDYTPRRMIVGMPFGCWLWVIGIGALAAYGLYKFVL